MEKPSEQKQEDSDVTFTSTGEELLSKPSVQEFEEQLHKKLTEEQAERLEDVDDCPKCHSSDINKMYIAGHDVLHCICNQCGKEWVE
jgi:hypothetical protein